MINCPKRGRKRTIRNGHSGFIADVYLKLKKGGHNMSLPESFVFPNPSTGVPYSKNLLEVIFMEARKATGINLWIYAAGKHRVLSPAGMNAVSPFIIKAYAGHASIKTSEKYVHTEVLAQKQILERTVTKQNRPNCTLRFSLIENLSRVCYYLTVFIIARWGPRCCTDLELYFLIQAFFPKPD